MFMFAAQAFRDGPATDAVEAIATGDMDAVDAQPRPWWMKETQDTSLSAPWSSPSSLWWETGAPNRCSV